MDNSTNLSKLHLSLIEGAQDITDNIKNSAQRAVTLTLYNKVTGDLDNKQMMTRLQREGSV